jgi:sugar phosphate isomerase/epimerase
MHQSSGLERLSLHQFVRMDLPLDELVHACVAQDVSHVALLRSRVEAFGVDRAVRLVRELGITVTSYSAVGYWSSGRDPEGETWDLSENLSRLDAAVALGAPLVVLAAGPLDLTSKDLVAARRRVAAGIAELWPHAAQRGLRLALEPLHPMFCPDRSVVTSLGLALDLVDGAPAEWVGVAIDSYHVWWDPSLDRLLAKAGPRIFAAHVSDFTLPLPPDRRRRGLMGEGCIDLRGFRDGVEAAGFSGPYEVEVQNEILSALPPEEMVARVVSSYREFQSLV